MDSYGLLAALRQMEIPFHSFNIFTKNIKNTTLFWTEKYLKSNNMPLHK